MRGVSGMRVKPGRNIKLPDTPSSGRISPTCELLELRLTWVSYGTAAWRATLVYIHSYQSVRHFEVHLTMVYCCQCSGFLTRAQMLMHRLHTGEAVPANTVGKSALKADSGRKIQCRIGESNPHQKPCQCETQSTRSRAKVQFSGHDTCPLMVEEGKKKWGWMNQQRT